MLGVLAGVVMSIETSVPPAIEREFRGVWVATVDNIDWPRKPGLPVDEQKGEMRHLLRLLHRLRFNAVILQVRPNCDAIYPSRLEPSSWYVTGDQGSDLGWDPLEFAVTEAHKLGLEVHAWFNPFRAGHPAQRGEYCESHVIQEHPSWVKSYGKYRWLDPGIPEAREHSLSVVSDVVKRYDIDGVHIDDYFYPYPADGAPFPDQDSYAKYGGLMDVRSWRRSNVDSFVRDVGKQIHTLKPWVKFGISPFGIYRPGVPAGTKSGVDQYEELAADVLKWWSEGWCDYLAPQLYWKTTSEFQPFEKLLKWWKQNNQESRHLWPGLYTGQLSSSGGNWPISELQKQIHLCRAADAKGQAHFSAVSLLDDYKSVGKFLSRTAYPTTALVPESPWLGGQKPPEPSPKIRSGECAWEPVTGAAQYATCEMVGGKWSDWSVSNETNRSLSPSAERVAVVAVGKTGAVSRAVTISAK